MFRLLPNYFRLRAHLYSTRRFTHSPAIASLNQTREVPFEWIYASPFAQTLRRLKWVSLTGCAAALIAAPFLYFSHQPDPQKTGEEMEGAEKRRGTKLTAILLVLLTGVGSTLLLNQVLSPYVLRMAVRPSLDAWFSSTHVQPMVRMETLNFVGRLKYTDIPLYQITKSSSARPFVTWQANMNGYQRQFYVHTELIPSKFRKEFVQVMDAPKS